MKVTLDKKIPPRIYLWARYPTTAPNCSPKQICLVSIIWLNRHNLFIFLKRGIILGFCIVILLITVAHSAAVSA